MSDSPLSVQLYTVRDALAADLPGTLSRISAIGYRNVELYGFVDRVDEYAELLPTFGLSVPSAHAHLVGDDVAPIFDAARRLGITTIIDPHIERERWTTRDDVAASATAINALSAIGTDYGLAVGYHNHWWEAGNTIDGTPAIEVFADLLDDAVVLEIDTYWAEVGGLPAPQLLTRLGQRVKFIHVKDGAVTHNNEEQTAVGSGKIDVLSVLAAAPQAMRVVELDGFNGDVFEALSDSFVYLTSNGVPA